MAQVLRSRGVQATKQKTEFVKGSSTSVAPSAKALRLVYCDESGTFRMDAEAVAALQMVKGPLGVASVCGRARQGKSFILNQLLGRSSGFQVASTHRPCTKGLWMWSMPLKRTAPDGTEYNLLLLDSEGIDAYDQTGTYSTQIFSLAVLLSSLFVYNQMGGIDEAALDRLSLVTEMTKHIRVRASEHRPSNAELGQFSPVFCWLLRDFYLDLSEDDKRISPRDYLESALQPISGDGKAIAAKNEIRDSIRALFPDRDCFTLVRPLNNERDLQRLDQSQFDSLRPEFRAGIDAFTKFVFERTKPKQLGSIIMTGPLLASLTQSFLDAINAGAVPTIATSWQNVEESECRRAYDAALELYSHAFNKSLVKDEEALRTIHEAAVEDALSVFNSEAVGAGAARQKYEKLLSAAFKRNYEENMHKIGMEAEMKCVKTVEKMDEKLWAVCQSSEVTLGQVLEEKRKEQKKVAMETPSMKGCGSNQITLYSWYLVKRIGSSESVEVSVGGFFGTAGIERFETATIVQRLEKCRLLAQDGVEVRLAGLIDDRTTASNGFSLNLVQSFLSGFPYTWNHLLDNAFRIPSTNLQDHQVLGDSGLSVAEASQLSFEGCCSDQERAAPSLSQKEVACDHLETPDGMEMNTKQNMTGKAQAEKESESLSAQAAFKDKDKLETETLKDDQLTISSLSSPLELDSSNTNVEELQANVLVDQKKCSVKRKPGRPSKAQSHPHVNREEGDTADTQIGAGNTAQLNQSPRITRSMHKINRHAASSENNHDFLEEFSSILHPDSFNGKDSVHPFEEELRPCVESRFCSSSSPLIQESVSEDRNSARSFSRKINRNTVDDVKALNRSPSHHTDVNPFEAEVKIPEQSLNAEASLDSKDGRAIIQEEPFVIEALQERDCIIEAEKDLPMVIPQSEVMEVLISKTLLNDPRKVEESNKEGKITTKSSRHCSKRMTIPPPLPCPRVPVAKHLISTAFGLKTSRSGRLLVPPLAHWCGQSLLRDKDGGIIAIADGSKDVNDVGTGSFKFKPPAEARLQKLQKRLCEAATDRTPSKKKRAMRKKSS